MRVAGVRAAESSGLVIVVEWPKGGCLGAAGLMVTV